MEGVLALMIPIVAIVMGIGSGMLKMHYKHKENLALNAVGEGQAAEVEGLSRIADILDQRVQILEKILDDEVPGWREMYDRRRA